MGGGRIEVGGGEGTPLCRPTIQGVEEAEVEIEVEEKE